MRWPLYLLLALSGCEPIEPQQSFICDMLTRCGQPREACAAMEQYRLTEACQIAIAGAPCDEHGKPVPSYMDECFPLCDPAGEMAFCLDDGAVQECRQLDPMDQLRRVVLDCEKACELSGRVYSNMCGREYMANGFTQNDPFFQCWCE